MILTDKCQALVCIDFPRNDYEILHRRFYYENTESIFGAPYKNNPTTLSQEHEPSLLKCAIPG